MAYLVIFCASMTASIEGLNPGAARGIGAGGRAGRGSGWVHGCLDNKQRIAWGHSVGTGIYFHLHEWSSKVKALRDSKTHQAAWMRSSQVLQLGTRSGSLSRLSSLPPGLLLWRLRVFLVDLWEVLPQVEVFRLFFTVVFQG